MKMNLKKFDVVKVDFGNDNIGSEQGGIRPAVIVQNDIGNRYSSTTIVMPLTSKMKSLNQSTHTLITRGCDKGLNRDSVVLGECLRQISEGRIIQLLGKITDSDEQNEIWRCYKANFGS